MKANALKRKVFQDAVDLISSPEEAVNPVCNGQAMIPVEKISSFHDNLSATKGKEKVGHLPLVVVPMPIRLQFWKRG